MLAVKRFLVTAASFGVLFAPLIGACTCIGAGYRAKSRAVRGDVPAALLGDPAAIADDTYVAVEARFRQRYADEFPTHDRWVVVDRGAALYDIESVPNVIAYCKDDDCAPLRGAPGAARLRGRVCGSDETFYGCRLEDSLRNSSFLEDEAKRRSLPKGTLRVLAVGASPSSDRVQMGTAFGFAGFDLAAYAGIVVLVATRRRSGEPRAVLDLTFSVPCSAIEARARLRERLTSFDQFRVERDDPDAFVFTQGHPGEKGPVLGVARVEHVPRRAVVCVAERPYHPTTVTVRLTEEITWLSTLMPPVEALCHAALARTGEQIALALRD
jgi:hypothetical protein